MADEKDSREKLTNLLYNRIDAGLGKRDAYDLADAIDNLISERITQALNQVSNHLLLPKISVDR